MICGEQASGERALMCAVLEDAVHCLNGEIGTARRRSRLALDARAWFEEHNAEWPFSFENICQALEFDAERLRTRLLAQAPEFTLDTQDDPEPRVRRKQVNPTELVEMIRAGHPLRVVAQTFGLSVPMVSMLSGGIASRLRAERDVEIRQLQGEGWTVHALAARFGLSRIRVMRICTRAERAGVVRRTAA